MWVTLRLGHQSDIEITSTPFSDPGKFCWSEVDNKCLSVREKDSESGSRLRRSCGSSCIPFSDLCEGECGPGQCKEGNSCLLETERDTQNNRIR